MYTLKLPRADELIHLREWHQGREAFGLWYVTMPDELSMYCQNLRLRFDDIFVPNYERVFHITLFVVGFCGVDDFCKTDLDKQIGALQDLNLSPFELSLSSLGTFDNSLHIKSAPTLYLMKFVKPYPYIQRYLLLFIHHILRWGFTMITI